MGFRKVATVVLMVSVGLASTAGANDVTRKDANDTRGRLDVSRVRHVQVTDSGKVSFLHTIRTFQPWKTRLLERDATEIDLWFSTDEDDDPERVVYIKSKNGHVRAEMNTYNSYSHGASVGFMGTIRARRPDERSVQVFVPKRWIKRRGLRGYDWWLSTNFYRKEGSVCTEWYRCTDSVPDKGSYRHLSKG